MTLLSLDIGADVYCRGERCGTLHQVIIDTRRDRITDLIVEPGGLNTTARVVPVALVERTGDEGIYLSITAAELDSYPEYTQLKFETAPNRGELQTYRPRPSWSWYESYGKHWSEPLVPRMRVQIERGVRTKASAIERDTVVRNSQGNVGYIDHVLIDMERREVTHIVIRRGVFPNYYIVPSEHIESIGDEAILISLGDEEINELQQFRSRPDEDVIAEVERRLAADERRFKDMDVHAQHGIVELDGVVDDMSARRRAEAIARSVNGVIDVISHLDTTLGSRVRSALRDNALTRRASIHIETVDGAIILKGSVASKKVRSTAEQIAERQVGVHEVNNQLHVDGHESKALVPTRDHDRHFQITS